MNLGIFLSIGDSFENMARFGQDKKFITQYLNKFSSYFDKIYVFSYGNDSTDLISKNVIIVNNKYRLHRYFYAIILPFLNYKIIKDCHVFRSYHLLGSVPAIVAKIFFQKPFIFNYAYDYFKFALIDKKYFQAVLIYLINPISLFFCHKFFVANKTLEARLISPKSIFLPNGVDVNLFLPSRNINKNLIKILSIGRLEKQKNFNNLILALSNSKFMLIIIGGGSQKENLINLAKNRKVRLKIIDKVDNKDIVGYYRQADVFILPSLIEGHPKVLLEAMSCAIPVVGSDVEGIKDIIFNDKNGLLCSTNPQSIKQSIFKLSNNFQLRKKLAQNARKTIERKYNLKILLKKEIQAIKSLN